MGAIADRLLQLIQKSDMSYADLEKATGIPKSALQRYATGVTEKIPVDRVKALASVLGSTAEYILGWDDEPVYKDGLKLAGAFEAIGSKVDYGNAINIEDWKYKNGFRDGLVEARNEIAEKQEKPATISDDGLDEELRKLLSDLTPEEDVIIRAVIQGIKAARKE